MIDQIDKHSQGTTIKNVVSVKVLKEIDEPGPVLSQQKMVVQEAKNYRSKTAQLEVIYQQKLISLTELKQSLLKKPSLAN